MLGLLAVQTPSLSPLDRIVAAVRSHRAISGVLRYTAFGQSGEVRFQFLAPGFVRLEGSILGGTCLTDGNDAWNVDPERRIYRHVTPTSVYAQAYAILGFNVLLRPPSLDYRVLLERTSPVLYSSERWEGRDVIAATFDLGYAFLNRQRLPKNVVLRIDPKSGLPLGIHSERAEDGTSGETYRYEKIVLDPPLRPEAFRFVPPKGYRDAATLTRMIPSRGRFGDPYPQVRAKAGEWVAEEAISLRAGIRVRSYGGMWVFDLEGRGLGPDDWKFGSVAVIVGRDWHFATLVPREDGRSAIVTFPMTSAKKTPKTLQLLLSPRKYPRAGFPAFVFEWPS